MNNIKTTHLHWGLELVFDESQKESDNEIWIDCYQLSQFLRKHRSGVQKVDGTKEWERVLEIKDPAVEAWVKEHGEDLSGNNISGNSGGQNEETNATEGE